MAITLTDEQKAIVSHEITAHGRVLAGPGTGKSLVAVALTERLVRRTPSPKVKFLTFTRTAAQELREKLSTSRAINVERPSTIHSFSISVVLKNAGAVSFPEPLRIPDQFEYHELVRPHLANLVGVSVRRLDDLIEEMAAKWESLSVELKPKVTPAERARFTGAWLTHRKIFGYTLLAELPDLLRVALRDHDDLRGVDYDLIIVDEYQDLNACELEIMKVLASKGSSILAIGDDDQSIYRFRKAHPAGIRHFINDFHAAKDYPLTVCHRSPRRIIEWAQFVIAGDIDREPRTAPSFPEGVLDGKVGLLRFDNETAEARGIALIVKWLAEKKGVQAKDVLILSRTDHLGAFSKPVVQHLSKIGVQVSDPSIIERLLFEDNNRNLLSILRLIVSFNDSLAWWSIMRSKKGVGQVAVQKIFEYAQMRNERFGDSLLELITGNSKILGPRIKATLSPLVAEIANMTNSITLQSSTMSEWGKWIVEGIKNGALPLCSDEFSNLLLEVDNAMETEVDLGQYLSQIQPLGKDILSAKSNGVRIMTMASSKGLTVKATIVMGVENDLIPRPDCDQAEERRLLYVAMTRSQEFLFLTWAKKRRGPGARAGRMNTGRRQESDFLKGGPVESEDGSKYVSGLV